MRPGTRRKRAILRDRQRGWHGITPLVGPLTDRDLLLIQQHYRRVTMRVPCMAATLAPYADPRYAASFHWCLADSHDGHEHECFCGRTWDDREEPLYPLTRDMAEWRLKTWEEPPLQIREA